MGGKMPGGGANAKPENPGASGAPRWRMRDEVARGRRMLECGRASKVVDALGLYWHVAWLWVVRGSCVARRGLYGVATACAAIAEATRAPPWGAVESAPRAALARRAANVLRRVAT